MPAQEASLHTFATALWSAAAWVGPQASQHCTNQKATSGKTTNPFTPWIRCLRCWASSSYAGPQPLLGRAHWNKNHQQSYHRSLVLELGKVHLQCSCECKALSKLVLSPQVELYLNIEMLQEVAEYPSGHLMTLPKKYEAWTLKGNVNSPSVRQDSYPWVSPVSFIASVSIKDSCIQSSSLKLCSSRMTYWSHSQDCHVLALKGQDSRWGIQSSKQSGCRAERARKRLRACTKWPCIGSRLL